MFNDAAGIGRIPAAQWRYATMAALSGPFLGRLTLMISARTIEARLSSLVMLLAPVLTLVPAYLILEDWPTERQLLGGVVMLLGIAFPLLRTRR